ncbi:MAG TPA: hybrid sensor histidine kinase/response regulator [Jatrophihabitans sp.]|nr:hybrid sensor histidine kinase/response regulator [Jatrophihabitans sp.]
MSTELGRLRIGSEADVFSARRAVRDVAAGLGYDTTDQVRLAIAVSEWGRLLVIARAAATVVLAVAEQLLSVELAGVAGALTAEQAEAGLAATRPLLDEVRCTSDRREIRLVKRLPAGQPVPGPGQAERLRESIAGLTRSTPLEDLQTQNQELLASLEDLKAKQDELVRLNDELEETNRGVLAMYSQLSDELEETNRGVVALYAELDERGNQLREANNAKSRFLASVSHELRSPLHSVIALTKLLREPDSEPLTPGQDEQVRLVRSAADQLLGLVNDLLDLAKAEASVLHPHPEPVDLAGLLGELRATLRPLTPPGVEFACVLAQPFGGLVTDPVLLGQVLRNLAGNALAFTEAGRVAVEVGEPVPGVVQLDVTDTGVGIAAEHQELVFEEFYQVPGPLQARRSGTGLGLAHVQRVVTALGGTLTLRSTPGSGSTFTVRLPSGRPGTVPDGGLGVVLVADDDPAARRVLSDLLAGLSTGVVEASDAAGAVAAARDRRPDLALLDLRMPGGGAAAVLPALSGLPVVVVTSAGPDDEERRRIALAAPVRSKEGLTREDLLAAVQTARSQVTR